MSLPSNDKTTASTGHITDHNAIVDWATAHEDLPAHAATTYTSGYYWMPVSPGAASTSATLGTNTLRMTPFIVTSSVTVTRIGAEVTTIGDAGSKVRLGIFADSGAGIPSTLVVDAGQIAGDSATVQELTVSQALTPGVYWVGGVVQSVTTTQPTLRTVANWHPPIPITASAIPSTNATWHGYSQSGVSGSLPNPPSSPAISGASPRIFLKVT